MNDFGAEHLLNRVVLRAIVFKGCRVQTAMFLSLPVGNPEQVTQPAPPQHKSRRYTSSQVALSQSYSNWYQVTSTEPVKGCICILVLWWKEMSILSN